MEMAALNMKNPAMILQKPWWSRDSLGLLPRVSKSSSNCLSITGRWRWSSQTTLPMRVSHRPIQ